jgi:LacI family transcriptional regulator, kdg operon repressor
MERMASFQAQISRLPLTARRGTGDTDPRPAVSAFADSFWAPPAKPGPRRLFCANGIAALACSKALRELGCRLFEDVGLIALDDLEWYPLVGSGITALAQPTEAIGASAFECLLKRLRGDTSATRSLDFAPQLIVRGSTQPV